MHSTATIPMTGAAAIGPIPHVLAEHVGDRAVERAFARADLSMAALETPRAPIPLWALTRLWENAARETGNRCFGFSGGLDMTHATYGIWLEYCASAPTLGAALSRIPQSLPFHQSVTRFSFRSEGAYSVLRYHPAWPGAFPQHSDHVIGSALRLIRSFLGENWMPPWVELDYVKDKGWQQLNAILQTPLSFENGTSGIAISNQDLNSRRNAFAKRILTLGDVAAEAVIATHQEPAASLDNVIAYRLLDEQFDIEGAAKFCGIGVQTLQRRLRSQGLTYREMLNQVRFRRAKELLVTTRMPISEIAMSLGYEDHGNFSHAFKKLAGASPSKFRAAG